MRSVRVLVMMVLMAGLLTPAVVGQDKAKTKDSQPPAGKMRGQLPPNYGKLGLSDDQKSKIYEIQGKNRAKIEDLQKQIADLREQDRKEIEKVLTPAQKDRLREIIASKAPGEGK